MEMRAHTSRSIKVRTNFSGKVARAEQHHLDLTFSISGLLAEIREPTAMARAGQFMLSAYGNEKADYDCAVYVIEAAQTGHCKVGISHNPLSRIKQLQCAHFADLKFASMLWAKDYKVAESLERLVLKAAGEMKIRARGEWIRCSADEASTLTLKAARFANVEVCGSTVMLNNISARAQAIMDIKGLVPSS